MMLLDKAIIKIKSKVINNVFKYKNVNKLAQIPANTIAFLLPDKDLVNGGFMSVVKIAEVTREIMPNTNVQIFIGRETNKIHRLTKFGNNETLFNAANLFKAIAEDKITLLHIPEMQVEWFLNEVKTHHNDVSKLHVNILNQNISIMPKPSVTAELKLLVRFLTQTTAHEKYADEAHFKLHGIPLKHLSTWVSPRFYERPKFEDKKNTVLFSPDKNIYRKETITKIGKLGKFNIKTIKSMTYSTYRSLIKNSKYMVSFGEGVDGYYVETVFAGGIAFTIYNPEFVKDEMRGFDNVFEANENCAEKITAMIKLCEEDADYRQSLHKQNFDYLAKIYGDDIFPKKLKQFYDGKFDFN